MVNLKKICKILDIRFRDRSLLEKILHGEQKDIRYLLIEKDIHGNNANYYIDEIDGNVLLHYKTARNIHKRYGNIKDKIIVIGLRDWSFNTIRLLSFLIAYLFCKYGIGFESLILPREFNRGINIRGTSFNRRNFIDIIRDKIKLIKKITSCK